MKKQISEKILEYTVIYEPAEEGVYVVSVPAIPGCVTQGENFEEATAMIKDAIHGCLSVLREEGQEIPQEQPEVVITKIAVNNPSVYL